MKGKKQETKSSAKKIIPEKATSKSIKKTKAPVRKNAVTKKKTVPSTKSSKIVIHKDDQEEEGYEWVLYEDTEPKYSDGSGVLATTERSVGYYKTKNEAIDEAKQHRNQLISFQGWADEFYGSSPPPYKSMHGGERFDEDEVDWITLRIKRQKKF